MSDNGTAPKRTTEGKRPGQRGRPPGSINKAKGLVPKDIGNKLLSHMEAQLSPDQFEYLKGVVRDGKPIQTKEELDVLIALLTRNLYPALIQEMLPEADGGAGGVYRKDVTDRLKIVQGLLNLRHQKDKEDDPDSNKHDTILTITKQRGFNPGRLAILVGNSADSMAGSDNGVGGGADTIRALPDSFSERPLDIPHREQGETDWVLDSDSDGSGSRSGDEAELQG